MRPALLTLVLAACTYTKSDWQADRDEAVCAILVDCFAAYPDAGACRSAQRRDPEGPCGAFRPSRARVCVTRLEAQAEACPTGDLTSWQVPVECADVCIYPKADTGS